MKTRSFFQSLGLLAAGVVLCSTVVHAQDAKAAAKAFPGLSSLSIAGEGSAVTEQISYVPAHTKVINKSLREITGQTEEGAADIIRLVSTRVDHGKDVTVLIDFDPGPSADPVFHIADEKTGNRIGSIATDALYVPGNGFIYAVGRSNNMNVERQKFAIRNGKVVEVKQPFSYVGLDTKANAPLVLTAGKASGEIIARIPKGDALQVVLRDDKYLLIKTRFGLVGWWVLKPDATADSTEIEGIYYAGD